VTSDEAACNNSLTPGSSLPARAPAVTSHGQQGSLSWQHMYTGSVRDIVRPAAERGSGVRAQHVDRALVEERLELGSFSGADKRHVRSHRSLNVLAERAMGPALTHRLGAPHEFGDPQGMYDPKNRCVHSPQIRHDPRGGSANPSSVHDKSHTQRESPRRLRGPPECRHSCGLHARVDDPHRPHSNLAAASAFPDMTDAAWQSREEGRAASASWGSTGGIARPLVKFSSLPDLDRQRSAGGSEVGELSDRNSSVCESTFISMPCIASSHQHHHYHQPYHSRRYRAAKRFLPTLSIPHEVSRVVNTGGFAYRASALTKNLEK